VADDTRINWQDYYGLNQGAYQQQAQGLLDPLAAQDAQLRRDVSGAARGAYQRGVMGQPGADWQTRQANDELMSYGDAVEALQNPSTLQAALEGSGHKRPVSALDAAGVQQAGGDSWRQASNRYQEANAYARQTTEKAAQDWQRGQADEARMAQQRADALAAKQRADEAEKQRKANWQRTLEAQEAGNTAFKDSNIPAMGDFADPSSAVGSDSRNLSDLLSGKTSEGNASDRLRELYHRARNPLARYGVKGNF